MELLSKAVPVAMLAFVVSSMLAVGVSLTVGQIMAPPAQRETGLPRTAGKFCPYATGRGGDRKAA